MLHTKERPQDFDSVVGNKVVITSLQEFFKSEEHPHCFLFHGASGSGKTTLARICAKELGATELDIYEYNIANTKGIDTARDIIDKICMAPLGKATVFILDEVHKSTGNFQEALLKPTEDVPPHVYFFLCTTETTKIIAALKRRFTFFKMEPIDNIFIFRYIAKVAKKYDIKISKNVLQVICDKSANSIGTALGHLEKVSKVEEEEQLDLLNMSEKEGKTVRDLCQAILKNAYWSELIPIVYDIDDFEGSRYAVLGYMAAVLMNSKSNKLHATAFNAIDIFSKIFYTKAEFVAGCYKTSVRG